MTKWQIPADDRISICTDAFLRFPVFHSDGSRNRTQDHQAFDLLLYRMQQFGEDSTVLAPVPYDYTDRTDEIGILHRQFTHMAERIQTLVVENYRQQLLTKDAQLKSLESQMNPHFLYNTLDAINWRAKAIGEPEISQIADSLGHFCG